MEFDLACEKLTTEIMQELAELLGEVDCELQETFRHETILLRINMAFGIGYNEGRKNVQQRTEKPVIQYTLSGKVIRAWESLAEADRGTGIDKSQIGKVANKLEGYNTAGGFKWKYADV